MTDFVSFLLLFCILLFLLYFIFYPPNYVQFVDVAPRNVVSRVEKKRMQPTVVERIVFSKDGRDMVTIDRRTGESGFDDVTSLKFWDYDVSTNEYVLNTRVRTPHSKTITSLSFAQSSSRGKIVVTASHDHKFKIWKPTTMKIGPAAVTRASSSGSSSSTSATSAASQRIVWDCHSVGFYRDQPIRDASMSEDGSVLAVAYDNIVTLWSPLDNMLQHTLPHPPSIANDYVNSVSFVDSSPLLVTTTKKNMFVWNLLTCDVMWELHGIRPLHVCCSGNSDWKDSARIAVVTNDSTSPSVLLFNAMSPTPIFRWSIPGSGSARPTGLWFEERGTSSTGSSSSSSASSSPSLLLVTESVQMYRLRSDRNNSTMVVTNEDTSMSIAQPVSDFQRMFGTRDVNSTQHSNSNGLKHAAQQNYDFNTDNNTILIDGPSHVVASVSSLFDTFMQQSGGKDAAVPTSTRMAMEEVEVEASSSNAVVNESFAPLNNETKPTPPTTFTTSITHNFVVSADNVPVRFDAASEEMLMEWFSKDGIPEVVIPTSSKKTAKGKVKPSSSKKQKRIGASVGSSKKKQRKK